jgi:Protein of unknown function (DUF5818)
MSPRILGIIGAGLCVIAAAGSVVAQTTQSSSTTQTSSAGTQKTASGQKTVTGCVAREGDRFVLKTDEGTYEFNTARDLSPYVGKKVKISGQWDASGVTTTAPIKGSGAAAEPTSTATGQTGAPIEAFVGDLRLHITGTVIGDCAPPK